MTLSAARRMLNLRSELTVTQDTNSSESATQVCNRAGRADYFKEQFNVHPSKKDASSSESVHAAAISEPLLSIFKAHRDEVVRRIQADQLFLKHIEELWAAFGATN
ncbi:hypothetical protein GN244_ATG10485 [Phytophthora infestans]|uniref:Uncharacterized protein n=1 Tax=Phytophthora infestans TaxID=4787 RepID=A0A833SP46_PHYIN|nr:hypothetical protein GN244_ATG10485 [Phytophthora infestans]